MKLKIYDTRTALGIVLSLFAIVLSCQAPERLSENVETLTESPVEEVVEKEEFDLAGKLATGESFRLPAISGCNYDNDGEAFEIHVEAPSSRQLIQISEILKYSGLPSNFKVLKTVNSIDNAFAAIIEGQRLIVFDEDLLKAVDDKESKDYWASMSILAHEIGHYLSGHTLDEKGSNHQSEMEADKFSGFVLYKMGADLEDAAYAMKQIGSEFDSPSHPSKDKRVEYINEGWNEANRQRYFAALPPPIDDHFEDENYRVYPDQILDDEFYEDLYINRSLEYTLIHKVEGIILGVETSQIMHHYEILITAMNEDHEFLKSGEVFVFGLDHWVSAFSLDQL